MQKLEITQLTHTSAYAFSALMLLVGWQEKHPACRKLSGGVPLTISCSSKSRSVHLPFWFYRSGPRSPGTKPRGT